MSRAAFGSWGAELDADEFACALAAAGATPDLLADDPVVWRDPRPGRLGEAESLARAWREAVAGRDAPWPLRLAVQAGRDEPWVAEQLSRPAVAADGVFVDLEVGARVSWSWPLQVAVLEDGRAVHRRIERSGYRPIREFVELVDAGPAPQTCDLLLVPLGLRAALARVLPLPLRASAVVLLGAPPERRTPSLLHALIDDVDAGAVAFAPARDRVEDWLATLLEHLAHDEGLDVALLGAARERDFRTPILFADRGLLAETLMRRVAARLEERVEVATAGAEPPPAAVARNGGPRDHLERAREVGFEHESDGASEVAAATRAARPLVDLPVAPRFIQGRVLEDGEERRALRTSSLHEVVVRVGLPDAEWLSADVAFPDRELPPASTHRLSVVLTEPTVLDEPQTAEIELPERGSSTSCSFWLRTTDEERPLEARIIVLHEGRILQTALLRGEILDRPDEIPADRALRLEVEAAVRAIAGLEGRTRFDAALVLNHDAAGVERITAVAGGRADVFVGSAPLGEAVETIQALLEDAVAADADVLPLEDERTLKLLVRLAHHGRLVYGVLNDALGDGKLADAERLQVVSVRPDAFLPVEFVYDRQPPDLDHAVLCPNAARALETGRCDDCPAETDTGFVCPLGFWGLRKVIERHAHDPAAAAAARGDFQVASDPVAARKRLRALSAAVFAASDRVDATKKGTIKSVAKALREATREKPQQAKTWTDWVTFVGESTPPLLVLIPHTFRHPALNLAGLEIAAAEQTLVSELTDAYVGASDEGGPIVLLLGCETGDPSLPFEAFPAQFRRCGAAIVLATLTKVLGRHAGPVACQIVSELAERAGDGGVTFGDVLRDVRRKLLRDGVPMALALTAYGDADWVLGES